MMGVARDSKWYDRFFRQSRADATHQYSLDPEDCMYAEGWNKALEWIADDEGILDIGCGPGQFAQLAIRRGKNYEMGVDFSLEAIDWAKQRNPGHDAHFLCADFEAYGFPCFEWFSVVVLLEVLEHIDDDLGLLARVPPGTHVVFSVPSIDYASHVRHFPTADDIVARYEPLLTLERVHDMSRDGRRHIWVWDAYRREVA